MGRYYQGSQLLDLLMGRYIISPQLLDLLMGRYFQGSQLWVGDHENLHVAQRETHHTWLKLGIVVQFPDRFTSSYILSFLLPFFFLGVLFHSRCSHAPVLGTTLVHEFKIFHSLTELNFRFSFAGISFWESKYYNISFKSNILWHWNGFT